MIRRSALPLALVLLAGCSDAGREPAAPAVRSAPATTAACADGETTFGKLTTTPVLIGVTPVIEINNARGGPLDEPMERIDSRTAGVATGPGVPARTVYQALQEQKFDDTTLVGFGTESRPDDTGRTTVDGAGRFVQYEYLRVVQAPFTWTCAGVPHTGTVTTWVNGSNSGLLDCDHDVAESRRGTGADAMYQQARELRC